MTKSNTERNKQLAPFDITLERGFLPAQDPLVAVPSAWKQWAQIAEQLPKLLVAGQLREHVRNLPVADVELLKGKAEYERAFVALSFVGHAYVWQGLDPPAT
jgi:indoleamine 2,3-dioxygenase